jgi:dTDP-4-dehydrorhamnose 3,5-epimerase
VRILEVLTMPIPEVKLLRFGRFSDPRGYFAETFRRSDIERHPELVSLSGLSFPQMNESRSRPGTVRGLHFQWNPTMGKLVRTLTGRMVDIVLDIRRGSPTLGLALLVDMPYDDDSDASEWIWVPPGFAHGNYFTMPTRIEYLCTGEWSPTCEAGISPLAPDIDWSLADAALKSELDAVLAGAPFITDKDRDGFSLASWLADGRSDNFVFGRV